MCMPHLPLGTLAEPFLVLQGPSQPWIRPAPCTVEALGLIVGDPRLPECAEGPAWIAGRGRQVVGSSAWPHRVASSGDSAPLGPLPIWP